MTINDALQQFLGEGTIETVAYFSFVSTVIDNGGASLRDSSSLFGEADVSVTYNYEYSSSAPEPTSMALIALGCAALGLRRKRIFTV